MKNFNFKIGTKINLIVIGIILLLSIVISFVSFNQVTKVMQNVFTDRVKVVSQLGYSWLNETYQGDWEIKDGELYKGEVKINENYGLIDKIGEITNGAVTIFQGDTRVTTNLMEDGKRIIGTNADPEISKIVLEDGQEFIGEAIIAGEKYLTIVSL